MSLPVAGCVGIFDSGLGGLSVYRVLKKSFPHCRFLYFADNLNLPYGQRSSVQIREYSAAIANFLYGRSAQLLVVACHTASVFVCPALSDFFSWRCAVVGMVECTLRAMVSCSAQRIGLIATQNTIHSMVYQQAFSLVAPQKTLYPLACPQLAYCIEHNLDGYLDQLLDQYLGDTALQDIEALVLACTHYPLVRQKIENFFTRLGRHMHVLDPAEYVAQDLMGAVMNQTRAPSEEDAFFCSHLHEEFSQNVRRILQKDVSIEQIRCG